MPPLQPSAAGALSYPQSPPLSSSRNTTKEAARLPFTCHPFTGEALGAELVGLDIMNNEITDDLVQDIRQALLTHQVSIDQ